MYLYYEHHKDAHGKTVLTEMRLSSYANGSLAINFRSPSENVLFNLCKTIVKFPPVAQRSYDESTKVWSYFEDWGTQVIEKLKEVTATVSVIQCVEVQDLAAQAVNNRVDLSGCKAVRPEDFFYNYGKPVAAPPLSKETVAAKLKTLMGDVLDKSAYRRAALRYHPDRNNGDGSKMSELNSLWSVYNA